MSTHAAGRADEEYEDWKKSEKKRKEDAEKTVRHRHANIEFAEVISMSNFTVIGFHDFTIPNRCGACQLTGIRSAENHYFLRHNARLGASFLGYAEKHRREIRYKKEAEGHE